MNVQTVENPVNPTDLFNMEDDEEFEKSLREFDESFETCPNPKRQKLSQPKQANNSKDFNRFEHQEQIIISNNDDIDEINSLVSFYAIHLINYCFFCNNFKFYIYF